MKELRLTQKQQEFAAEHHKALEDFLKFRGLPMDEFYDVVVFSFLRAVQQYDECEELRQQNFNTVAKDHMRSALERYFRSQRRQRNYQMLSLDHPLAGHPNITLGDTIADTSVDICEEVCEKLSRTPKRFRLSHTSSFLRPLYHAALKEVA